MILYLAIVIKGVGKHCLIYEHNLLNGLKCMHVARMSFTSGNSLRGGNNK